MSQRSPRVVVLGEDGKTREVAEVPTHPSGIDWDSDGRLLVVSMHERKVLRKEGAALETLADLSSIAHFHCNDMTADRLGRAYVGNFGFDLWGGGSPSPTNLALVEPSGAARIVATDLMFPNGIVITPDERTLILSETFTARLLAFDIESDGSLSGRRVWAEVGRPTDGICLDAEGCVWAAVPLASGAFLRVAEGGEIKEEISADEYCAIACMLGGKDGKTLFLLEALDPRPERMKPGNGRIRAVEVAVPHAGRP
jgi:sugar lactone lactonase YvrE